MNIAIKRMRLCVLWAFALVTSPADAAIADYGFELLQPEFREGDDVVIAVRLVNKRTGQAVPDAVIFATRIDMAPDGMPTMDAPLEPMPPPEPGVYRFATALMMAGGWELSLAAKVQGEEGTVVARLFVKAVP